MKTFNAYDYIIQTTSEDNLYLVQSSNKYDWHAVILTGHNAAICSCKAGQTWYDDKGNIIKRAQPCGHRDAVRARFTYLTPNDYTLDDVAMARIRRREREYWAKVADRAETEAERDSVRTLWDVDYLPPVA